jgi:general secretion pathway protein I
MPTERGFTLLEVLVAFIIAALALGVLYEGAFAGLFASRVASHTAEAASRARSHLAVIGHGMAIQPGDSRGDDGGGYQWRVSIRQLATAPTGRGDPTVVARGPRAALYAVTVRITWQMDGAGREVRLDTEIVGPAAAAGP